MSKKDIDLTPEKVLLEVNDMQNEAIEQSQAINDDYNNPHSNTKEIIEALKEMQVWAFTDFCVNLDLPINRFWPSLQIW